MMKPEPSERLSERGPGPGAGPGPGWRGMERRENSSPSSSSMPGTCGSELGRRAACVVLMLTTALPCSSTRRVKSGSCACACAASENTASHSAATPLRVVMFLSWVLGTPILHRIGNALHTCGGCFAYDGHHVVRDLAGIDMNGAEAGEPGARRLALRRERLDENRHRRGPVGEDELSHGLRFAHAPRELDYLVEPRQFRVEAPARQARRRRRRLFHAPVGRGMARLHHVRGDASDEELRKRELLYRAAGGIDRGGAHQHAARRVRPQAITVAQVVLRREHHALAFEAADAAYFAKRDVVVAKQRVQFPRKERWKVTVGGASLDLDDVAFRQIAAHGV